jgi:hypothetical protein
MIKNIKNIIIVYNPGYAGNFLSRLFSLNLSVCPQVKLGWIENNIDIFNKNRSDLYSFNEAKNKYENWQLFHRDWADLYQYKLIEKYFEGKQYSSIIFSCHEPEFQIHKELIDSIENKVILGVKLEDQTNLSWVKLAQRDLNFKYRFEEENFYSLFLNSLDNEYLIDLDLMLNSENDFLHEYQRISKLLGLPVDNDTALKFYKEWYTIRVKCYLQ